jgi:hypothetical protein
MGASAAFATAGRLEYAVTDGDRTLEGEGWQLQAGPRGDLVSWTDGRLELVNRGLGNNNPRVLVMGKKLYTCDQPGSFRREGLRLIYRYEFSDPYQLFVDYELELMKLRPGEVALRQKVALDSPQKISEDVKLVLPRNFQLPFENRNVFVPLKNGIGRRKPVMNLDNDDEYLFRLAGDFEGGRPQMLAIPMIDEYADQTDVRLAICADPYFTSHRVLPCGKRIGMFHCIYPRRTGLKGREERVVYTGIHRGGAAGAMPVFYGTALHDIKPGPTWLHDVAMIDYDYLSKNGEGWFADIQKLEQAISTRDRSKVFLALHGWYDCVGRYTYDLSSQSLDKTWTAFPSARDPKVQAMGDAPEQWTEYYWHKAAVQRMQPVKMSIEDVHRRIKYAKERGFRVGVYFADGLAACDGVKQIYDPTKVLTWGGWEGPDTVGRTYQQSPLHPGVREFYKGYMRALLAEYGKEVDGFIWDETFFIDPGQTGTEAYPGYADRAMMTLVKELVDIVARSGNELAFFASDVIGVRSWTHKAPYALVAHATYQDSGSRPEAWPYGLFPNFRNTLWSCNWAPVSHFHYTQYGVTTFDTPVTISNGAAGDDIGVSDMSAAQFKSVMDLFDERKQRRMTIGWIEENAGSPTYQDRQIKYKWSL